MFGKSYSKKSLTLFAGKLIEMNEDSYWFFPDDVPSTQDIQLDGISSLFGRKKKEKQILAGQRAAFSNAVILVMAEKCFDGKEKDFYAFVEKGIISAFGKKVGKMVIKSFSISVDFRDYAVYGREWALNKI